MLGTDQLGRDLAGPPADGRPHLASVGFAAMLISIVFGTMVGAVAGYYGGWIGAVLMRLVDAVLCFPTRVPAAGPGRLHQAQRADRSR